MSAQPEKRPAPGSATAKSNSILRSDFHALRGFQDGRNRNARTVAGASEAQHENCYFWVYRYQIRMATTTMPAQAQPLSAPAGRESIWL